MAVLDKGKTFVTRIEAERDAALADARRLREHIEQIALEAESAGISRWNAPTQQLEGAIEDALDAVVALAATSSTLAEHDASNSLRVELLHLRDALRDQRVCSGACECEGCVRSYERAIDTTKASIAMLAEHDAKVRAAALEEAAREVERRYAERRTKPEWAARMANEIRALAKPKDEDSKRREPGCMCHLEEGDSPCPVHDRVEVVRFAAQPNGSGKL